MNAQLSLKLRHILLLLILLVGVLGVGSRGVTADGPGFEFSVVSAMGYVAGN